MYILLLLTVVLSAQELASVQFSSVAQSCPTLCNPMSPSTPGLPVHHQLPESTQTHVHRVGDAIQPSHPLSSPSPPVLNLSQHQGLFQRVSSLHQVAKVLEFQLLHQFSNLEETVVVHSVQYPYCTSGRQHRQRGRDWLRSHSGLVAAPAL